MDIKKIYAGRIAVIDYDYLFSAVIPAGVNVAYICTQVKSAVDDEQSKALWVPRGPP